MGYRRCLLPIDVGQVNLCYYWNIQFWTTGWIVITTKMSRSGQILKKLKLTVTLVTISLLIAGSSLTAAYANSESGLKVTVYDNNGAEASPAIPDDSKIALTTTYPYVGTWWGFGPIAETGLEDDVVIKYESTLTSEITGPVSFYADADDGVKLYLDGELVIDDWYDKGCCGNLSEPVWMTAGVSKTFTLYFYENGGGAYIFLYWDLGNGLEFIPQSAYEIKPVNSGPVKAQTTQTAQPPKGISAVSDGRNALRVQWSRPTGSGSAKVLRYEIYRNGSKVASVPGNQFFYRDKGLDPTQSYSYRVVSVTAKGRSASSSSSSSMFPRR
jgi:hypothetical protein